MNYRANTQYIKLTKENGKQLTSLSQHKINNESGKEEAVIRTHQNVASRHNTAERHQQWSINAPETLIGIPLDKAGGTVRNSGQ